MYQNALEILKKISKNNFEAYIIGGYPRDKYLNIKNTDIDICTNAKFKDLKKIFKEIKDNKYGSYRIKYKNQEYEITTYRKERKYIKNRFPKITRYTKKLKTDLKRRDFVINTLCIDRYGNYIDFKGAKKDLDEKIIRLIGRKKKIKDDSLRILRAIRFATRLNFKLDKKLEDAIKKYKQYLENISSERKKTEIIKILTDKNAKYGIELIKKFDLEKYLKINLDNLVITQDINGIWAQILIDESYNFTKEEYKEINKIVKLINKNFDIYDLYKYGPKTLETVCKIKDEDRNINKIYKKLKIKDRDDIKVNFFEIFELISATNKKMKIIYEDLEKKILYGILENDNKKIKEYIKENY
jgi:tRNA nucleotidyltransferase/poly(A) polymerase